MTSFYVCHNMMCLSYVDRDSVTDLILSSPPRSALPMPCWLIVNNLELELAPGLCHRLDTGGTYAPIPEATLRPNKATLL